MALHTEHDLLAAYALDAVDDVERRAVERHLDRCEACAAELRGYREAVVSLAAAAAVQPPPAMRRVLELAQQQGGAAMPQAPRRAPRWRTAAAAAAVALLAVAGAFALLDPSGEREVAAHLTGDPPALTLVVDGLDPAPPGTVHAVWVLDDGVPTLVGELHDGEATLPRVRPGDEVAVTHEPAPAPASPTGEILVRVPVEA